MSQRPAGALRQGGDPGVEADRAFPRDCRARRGHGAFLNETARLPLAAPRPLPSLSSALVGVEWGSARAGAAMAAKIASFAALAAQEGQMVHGLRSLGSAAMNYAMVASGGLDLYWSVHSSDSVFAYTCGLFLLREIGCW